jgi:limonene-1,2-epoxide hydrolase
VGTNGIEVCVPIREGADGNAVLAECMDGFSGRRGGGARSSSMQVGRV